MIQKSAAMFLLVLVAGTGSNVMAQLDPMTSQYFQNQYLANPAMLGMDAGLTLNAGFRKRFSSLPGSPVTQTLTAEYQMNNRVGWGMNLYNDVAGLIGRTRVTGSYAYHMPLNENRQLHLGISLGFMNGRIDYQDIEGEQGDVLVGRFNERDTYIDGDFGAAYTDRHLTVQAAVPNMKSFFGTDDNNSVDRAVFYSALSYRWFLNGESSGTILEPKVAYRGVKGHDNLLDAGANLTMAGNQVIFTGMYHTSGSATFGMGVNYKKTLTVLGMYSTETAAMQKYADGNFELGLRYQFMKKESGVEN